MEEAIEKMNGFDFSGKFLKVNKAGKKEEMFNNIVKKISNLYSNLFI